MKRNIVFLICGFLALATATICVAQEFKKIDAKYEVASKTILDPPPGEKKDRVLLFLTGRGAKEIYDSIPGSPQKGVCGLDMSLKAAGNFECVKDNKSGTYQCSVGILLDSGTTAKGSVC